KNRGEIGVDGEDRQGGVLSPARDEPRGRLPLCLGGHGREHDGPRRRGRHLRLHREAVSNLGRPVITPMSHDDYSDSYIRGILNTVKAIAMVGVSANTSRPSYFAFKYLGERGYRMIPVNPGLAGQEL